MIAALKPIQPDDRSEPTPGPGAGAGDGIDTARFSPIGEAADRLGLSRSVIQRRCREKWQPAGMALMASPPGGGSPTWYIARRADTRLAVHLGETMQESDLTPFTDTQQQQARQRAECVKAYRKLRETEQRPQGQ